MQLWEGNPAGGKYRAPYGAKNVIADGCSTVVREIGWDVCLAEHVEMKLASQLNPDIFVQFRSCIFPIHNFQKIKTNGKISSQQNSSNGGVEGEVVLDQLNFAKVEEIVDALNFRELELATSRVEENDKTEANDKQRVAEEPKYLE